ncbi:MAG: primosomal protein N', partial [Synechococcus sp.]|nr:primosomal protein N' [Synechococcus sp.]
MTAASSSPPIAPPAPFVQVWLEAGREGQVFTYANPEALPLGPGDLVAVRLQGRRHGGLVVERLEALPPELEGRPLEPVLAQLQPAAVDPHWRDWIAAVAQQCHTSVFRTLKTALPAGWLGQGRRATRVGSGAAQPRGMRARRWVVPRADPPPAPPRSERQARLLAFLQGRDGGASLEALQAVEGYSPAVLRALERGGWVERCLPPGTPPQDAGALGGAGPAGGLTPAQQEALQRIEAAAPGRNLLLWGVTGAGKTEVYLQAAAAVLREGGGALLLTPEIGLIPQLLDRCRERFGERVLEYHSGLGEAERVRAWRRCLEASASGEPLLAVGTRSAVFLPVPRLALLVLDEEHDDSYKQDSPMPCYHAREVARLRVARCGARLLLGTATPSLETWLRCQGPDPDTLLLRLPERIGARPLPPVRVVDMRLELEEGHRKLLSRALLGRLQELQGRGEQAVVLVPRRGYRSFLSCRSCGEVVLCPHCDVALTVHRTTTAAGEAREWLRCHWCDHRQELSRCCGHCGSTAFMPFGAGTQRVMEQLAEELEGLRLLRFDRDTTRGRDGHRRLL